MQSCNNIWLGMGTLYAAMPGQSPGVARIISMYIVRYIVRLGHVSQDFCTPSDSVCCRDCQGRLPPVAWCGLHVITLACRRVTRGFGIILWASRYLQLQAGNWLETLVMGFKHRNMVIKLDHYYLRTIMVLICWKKCTAMGRHEQFLFMCEHLRGHEHQDSEQKRANDYTQNGVRTIVEWKRICSLNDSWKNILCVYVCIIFNYII